jgi:hypothetical protein
MRFGDLLIHQGGFRRGVPMSHFLCHESQSLGVLLSPGACYAETG